MCDRSVSIVAFNTFSTLFIKGIRSSISKTFISSDFELVDAGDFPISVVPLSFYLISLYGFANS